MSTEAIAAPANVAVRIPRRLRNRWGRFTNETLIRMIPTAVTDIVTNPLYNQAYAEAREI